MKHILLDRIRQKGSFAHSLYISENIQTKKSPALSRALRSNRCAISTGNDLVNGFLNRLLGNEPDYLVRNLAAFEQQQRGNPANTIPHGCSGIAVDIHFHD